MTVQRRDRNKPAPASKRRTGQSRGTLSSEVIFRAAIAVADHDGVERLSMRRLARELRVEAPSLYHHIPDKEQLLDGIVDTLVSDIEAPRTETEWMTEMRTRALSGRRMVQRHPWAPRLIATRRSLSPTLTRYWISIARVLHKAGFSIDLAHHAIHAIGPRLLGFAPDVFDETSLQPDAARAVFTEVQAAEPDLAAFIARARHDDQAEFVYGLELILEAIEREHRGLASRPRSPRSPRVRKTVERVSR